MRIADVFVAIKADTKPFNDEMRTLNQTVTGEINNIGTAAESNAGRMQQSFGKAFNAIKPLAIGFVTAFASTKLLDFLGDAIQAAGDLAETTSKVNVVFGDAADEVLAMGKTSANALGMSEEAALSAAGTYGNLFRAMGLTEEVSAQMSVELVQLAADLASFNNMDPTEVLDKLRAGLSGETEPLKTLGINLSAARIEAKAFEMGLVSATGELTAGAKAQATYALILEDTTLAQGDFARTSDGLANQQRILEANLANVTAEIGQKLLPVMTGLANFANDTLVPVLGAVVDNLHLAADAVDGFLGPLTFLSGATADMGAKLKALDGALVANGRSWDEHNALVREAGAQSGRSTDEINLRIGELIAGGASLSAAWRQTAQEFGFSLEGMSSAMLILPKTAGEVEKNTSAAMDPLAEGISGPVQEGTDDAVEDVDSMYTRIALVIADREKELIDAGNSAADAWLTPQRVATETALAEAELFGPELAAALSSADPLIRAEAEARRAALTAELQKLYNEQVTIGTSSEQFAAASSLRQSQFMLDGLASSDPEIRALFQAWDESLALHGDRMERDAALTGAGVPEFLRRGFVDATPGITNAGAGLGSSFIGGVVQKTGEGYTPARNTAAWVAGGMNVSGTAWNGGYSTGWGFVSGILAGIAARNPYLAAQLAAVRRMLGGSLPEAGPLKGNVAELGGRSIGATWVHGLAAELRKAPDLIGNPLSQLGLMPATLSSGSAGGMAGVQPGNPSIVTNQWILNANGAAKTFERREDFMRELDAMSSFGGDSRL